MALIHWWPLNGDTKDYGLNPGNNGSGGTVNNNGKIGKCYEVKNSSYLTLPYNIDETGIYSISMWLKIPTSMSTNDAWETFFFYRVPSGTIVANWANYKNLKIYDDSKHQYRWLGPGTNFNYDTWFHLTLVHSTDNTQTTKFYINGNLLGQNTSDTALKISSGNFVFGSGISVGSYFVNDVRIYNHALTSKEVKEISKGLILHYDFEDEEIESTTNIDPMRNNLKDNASTPSGMGKPSGATISIVDFDGYKCYKLEINKDNITSWYGCYCNSNPISQGASVGQTVTRSMMLYVPSGQTLPGHFTESIEGNSSNKTFHNYDYTKPNTWQKVWLTGTIADTGTNNYLHYFCAVSSGSVHLTCYMRDFQMEIKDHATPYVNGTRNGIVYDSSGYNYNGISGSDVSISSSSILGKTSLKLSGGTKGNPNSSYIEIPNSPDLNIWTVNIWCNITAWSKNGTTQCLISGKTYSGNFDGYMKIDLIGQKLGVRATSQGSGYSDYVVCNTAVQLNTPCMLTIVSDGTTLKGYFNGVYEKTVTPDAKYGNKYSPGSIGRAWSDGYWNPDGLIYDFKVYATALSASDILKEYQSMADIDKKYNLTTRVFNENLPVDAFNLVYNGKLELGNNTGFTSGVTYDSSKGAVKFTGDYACSTKYPIEIDPNSTYKCSFKYMVTVAPTSNFLLTLFSYDRNKSWVSCNTTQRTISADTTLAQALTNGATTAVSTSSANWKTGDPSYARIFGVCENNGWGYNRATKFAYYSSISGNTVTLNSAWNQGTIPAGTRVSNFSDGGTYRYPGSISKSTQLNTWYEYSYTIRGNDIRATTAYVGLGILPYSGTMYVKDLVFENITKPQLLNVPLAVRPTQPLLNENGVFNNSFLDETSMRVRYIRDELNGSTANAYNHWVELAAYNKAGFNIALGKALPSGSFRITDGDTTSSNYISSSAGTDSETNYPYVQLDLGYSVELTHITSWHYFADGRKYNHILRVSTDGTKWFTVFDSNVEGTYAETPTGHTVYLSKKLEFQTYDNGVLTANSFNEK